MKLTKLLASLALMVPVTSHAQGWYVGFDVGSARADSVIDEHFLIGDTSARASGTTTGFRLRGGYQFGRFVALEAAYVDFGEFENHLEPDDCPAGAPGPCPLDVRTSISGLVATLRGIVPIGDHWYMDARLGWGKMDVDANQIGGSSQESSVENAALHYGIGGGYRFNEHWAVALDYSEYNQQDLGLTLAGEFGIYDLGETSVTSLGVSYRW